MQHPYGQDAKCWIKTKGPLHAEANATKLAALVKAGTGIDAKVKARQFAETFCTEVRMEKVMVTTRQYVESPYSPCTLSLPPLPPPKSWQD